MVSQSPTDSTPKLMGEDLHRGLRRRQFNNTVLAYLLILPSTFITFLFGVYPVVSGLWESLQDGIPITNNYVGLDQYLKGVGSLIYIIIGILSFIFCYLAYNYWQVARQQQREHPKDSLLVYLVPSFIAAFGIFGTAALFVTTGYRYVLFPLEQISNYLIWLLSILPFIGIGTFSYCKRSGLNFVSSIGFATITIPISAIIFTLSLSIDHNSSTILQIITITTLALAALFFAYYFFNNRSYFVNIIFILIIGLTAIIGSVFALGIEYSLVLSISAPLITSLSTASISYKLTMQRNTKNIHPIIVTIIPPILSIIVLVGCIIWLNYYPPYLIIGISTFAIMFNNIAYSASESNIKASESYEHSNHPVQTPTFLNNLVGYQWASVAYRIIVRLLITFAVCISGIVIVILNNSESSTISLISGSGILIALGILLIELPQNIIINLVVSIAVAIIAGSIILLGSVALDNSISFNINVSVIWLTMLFLIIGFAGYHFLGNKVQGKPLIYSFNTLMVMLLTLLAVLMIRYAFTEIKSDVEEAREVAALILTTDVGNARPLRPIDGVEYVGIELAEEVPVQVEINNQIFEAQLSPEAYNQIDADKLGDASFVLGNNQKVDVVMPLHRGLGFAPINYYYEEANLILESSAGDIGGGPPSLEVPIVLDDPSIQAPYDIFQTSEVGDLVVTRGGYTTPVDRPMYATLGILGCLGAIYIFGNMQENATSNETSVKTQERLSLLRGVLWVVVLGLAAYVVSHIQFYQSTAHSLQALSFDEFRVAYEYVTGTVPASTLRPERLAQRLLFLPQALMIMAGAIFVVMAYMIWNNAKKRDTTLGMFGNILFATFLMVGGWLFISELPNTIMLAGTDAIDTRDALVRTALYSIGTVPVQLALGMVLAYLMFYEVTVGKSMFRLFYFMPYIAPQIATATVFTVIFSLRPEGLANQFLGLFGVEEQLWLKEGNGVLRVTYEVLGGDPAHVPAIFQGPSLALLTVILFNIWVYAGYNAVIFLAGLGSIPGELYEAARVDGAGRWAAFRNITFPLLSPVTFFLSMLGIIGTFKAFGSVYVLRDADNDYVDTITIRIFNVLQEQGNQGYAASLAFVLFAVILLLTLAQNRLSRDRVFYG